jgi:hypothetical protein
MPSPEQTYLRSSKSHQEPPVLVSAVLLASSELSSATSKHFVVATPKTVALEYDELAVGEESDFLLAEPFVLMTVSGGSVVASCYDSLLAAVAEGFSLVRNSTWKPFSSHHGFCRFVLVGEEGTTL